MSTQGFVCPECGTGRVAPRAAKGRVALAFPGVEVELPESLVVPTCSNGACLDWSYPDAQAAEVREAIGAELLGWQRAHVPSMLQAITDRNEVTQQRIAAALGVTPSHLSHVANGTHAASATLLRLLHGFAANALLFEHALKGWPLERFGPTAFAPLGFALRAPSYESVESATGDDSREVAAMGKTMKVARIADHPRWTSSDDRLAG